MIEPYLGMAMVTAIFVWTRMPPHKDWFELLMLVSVSMLWPMLLAYAAYLIWADPLPASADTRPQGGDAQRAPFTSGAAPEGQTPNPSSKSQQ